MDAVELGVDVADVLARDLFLVNRQRSCVWGMANEFVSAPKLDDLACAYTSLEAMLAQTNEHDVSLFACFDNEEVGSGTKQGAMSTFLRDTLARVNEGLGFGEEDYRRALAASMLVSCDNAHALHPNRPDCADEGARPKLNSVFVINDAANQHYCTDAFSRAALVAVLENAQVPYQAFANRSDMAGGSTLGSIAGTLVPVSAVDIGLAQLAMHAAVEVMGAEDYPRLIAAIRQFYKE